MKNATVCTAEYMLNLMCTLHQYTCTVHSLTPVIKLGLCEAGVLHHTGDFLSMFGSVLQVGVDLVEPIPIGQLLSGGHIRCHFFSIPQPRHSNLFGIKVVHAADEDAWMLAAACFN